MHHLGMVSIAGGVTLWDVCGWGCLNQFYMQHTVPKGSKYWDKQGTQVLANSADPDQKIRLLQKQ